MIRFLAFTAVFFALPFATYFVWVSAKYRRWPEPRDWPTRIVIVLCVIGAVLMLIGLVILVLSDAGPAGQAPLPGANG
jgi:heme/copper-type cytochrome/quinol oxidase subunit 3